jgi:putative addiction module CopG family antidote
MAAVRKTITLTDMQDSWIKAQIDAGHYTNDSEYIRDLIRREHERSAENVMGAIPLDWRWLANGYLKELLYEKNVVNRSMPFAALKSLSFINPKARALPLDDNFSDAIHQGLLPRPAPPATISPSEH